MAIFQLLLVLLLATQAPAATPITTQGPHPVPLTLADLLALPSGDGAFVKAVRAGSHAQALACASQGDPARTDPAFPLALAFSLENQGRWADAAASYEAALASDPTLQDWARFGLARTLRRLAPDEPDPLLRAALEARSQEAYLTLAPDFPRRQEALETVCEQGDGASALEACLTAARTRPDPDTLLAAARRHLAAGQHPQAKEALDAALLLRPTGYKGRAIQALREAHFGKAPRAPEGTGMPILDRLFAGHSYKRVVELATTELPTLEPGSRRWCDLSLLAGRALTRQSRESASLPWLTGIMDRCGDLDPFDLDMALYLLADNAYKAEKLALCRRAVQRLREVRPGSRYCDDALLILARAELRAGNEPAAREAVAILQDHYPQGDMLPDALFLLQFDAWRRGDLARVRLLATHFAPRFDSDRDYRTQGRLRYWGGRALEKLKQPKEARAAYAELACRWPLSWYSLLALQRLETGRRGLAAKTLATCAAASPALPQPNQLELAALPSQAALQRGISLYRVGLGAWAAEEWANVDTSASEPAALTKAALLDALGNQVASHDLLRRQAPSLMTSFPAGPNRLWWELAYPQAHRRPLEKWSAAHGIPAELAFAITREESGFNPRARSFASAMGLMQLLRKTARWVGREMNLRPSERDLYSPDMNVRLGTRYLAMLRKDLGHQALAVAGYNCGGGCIKKLRKRHPTRELDEFVELIPYAETNRYTKRVLSSVAVYTWLYGKDLVKKLPPLKLP
jgi:soluble lytic murein transglycosylase